MNQPHEQSAFPVGSEVGGGLTYLDYMAAAALTGLLAFTNGVENCMQMEPKEVSEEAYNIAEAMLAERDRRSQLRRIKNGD